MNDNLTVTVMRDPCDLRISAGVTSPPHKFLRGSRGPRGSAGHVGSALMRDPRGSRVRRGVPPSHCGTHVTPARISCERGTPSHECEGGVPPSRAKGGDLRANPMVNKCKIRNHPPKRPFLGGVIQCQIFSKIFEISK